MTEMVLGIGKARASNRAATVDRPGRRIRSARPSNRRSHRQGRPAASTRPRRRKRGGAASACAWTSRNRPAPHPPETDPARVDLHVEHRPRTHEAGDLTGYALVRQSEIVILSWSAESGSLVEPAGAGLVASSPQMPAQVVFQAVPVVGE